MLPRECRENALCHRELFDLGLIGPDLLFFHDPYLPRGLARTGRAVHYGSGRQFFQNAGEACERHGFSPLYRAYLDGLLCHFALDCLCHGFVRNHGELTHSALETEFDRFLLLKDGLDPFRFPVCGNLVSSVRNAVVVSAFYPGAKPGDIRLSIRSMTFFTNLLRAQEPGKRRAVLLGFRLAGQLRRYRGLLLEPVPNARFEEANRRFWELYRRALPLAAKLIREFRDTWEGKFPPDPHYRLNFESQPVEREGLAFSDGL